MAMLPPMVLALPFLPLTVSASLQLGAAVGTAEGRVLWAGSRPARGWGQHALPPLTSHVLGTPVLSPVGHLGLGPTKGCEHQQARGCHDGDGNR